MVDDQTLREAAAQLWAADGEVNLPVTAPPDDLNARLVGAQGFLAFTKSTVESTLASLKRVRRLRRTAQGQAPQGQLRGSDVDLLRTALLFAGAGLDATLRGRREGGGLYESGRPGEPHQVEGRRESQRLDTYCHQVAGSADPSRGVRSLCAF